MTTSGTYRLDDDRFNPMLSDRIAAAWIHITKALQDGRWTSWSAIVEQSAQATGLADKTISNLIHKGVSSGYFERDGDYRAGTRRVRQVRWP